MHSHCALRRGLGWALAVVASVLWTSAACAQATWTGAASPSWGTPGNWSGTAPTNGSSLAYTFGAVANQSTNNNLTSLTATAITFNTGGFDLAGNGITLGGNIDNQAGANSISFDMNMSNDRTVTVATGTQLTIGGTITSSGSRQLTKAGAGTLVLSGANNSYSGPTIITGGVLVASTLANGGAPSSIGESPNGDNNLILAGGTLRYTGGAVSTTRAFQVGQPSGILTAVIDSSGSGPIVFTGNNTSIGVGGNGARTLTLTGSNMGFNSIEGLQITGTGSNGLTLLKTGTGTWALGRANGNNYTGGTIVSDGTLLVNNDAGLLAADNTGTGTGPVVVNGGRLGGSGRILPTGTNSVTINNGGTITAGTGPGVNTTTLTIAANGLTINNGGTYAVSLFGTATTEISLLAVSDGTTIDPVAYLTLDLAALSAGQVASLRSTVGIGNTRTYTILTGLTGSNFTPANFSVSNLGNFAAGEWMFNTMPAVGTTQLNFTPVPEPASVLALSLGATALYFRLRRRAASV